MHEHFPCGDLVLPASIEPAQPASCFVASVATIFFSSAVHLCISLMKGAYLHHFCVRHAAALQVARIIWIILEVAETQTTIIAITEVKEHEVEDHEGAEDEVTMSHTQSCRHDSQRM